MSARTWVSKRLPSLPTSVQARRVFILLALAFVGGCFASFQACSAHDDVGSSTQTQALTSSGDPAGNRGGLGRTGEYYDNYLTSAQVDGGAFKRAPVAYDVDGPVYAQPVVVQGVPMTNDYKRNILLVATTHNQLTAFDADRISDPNTGGNKFLWQADANTTFGQPPTIGKNADATQIYGNPIQCENVGHVGILSTPYIDTTNFIAYVVSASLPSGVQEDAQAYDAGNPIVYKLWAINLKDGTPVGPAVQLGGSDQGVSFNGYFQIQRPATAPVTVGTKTYLLIAFSSSCDGPTPYYGWVISQEITNPSSLNTGESAALCTTCGAGSNSGGIWMSGQGLTVDNQGNVYFQNGNGDTNGGTYPNTNTVFKVQVIDGGKPVVADYFSPYNRDYLNANDLDLGVSGLAWLGGDGGGPNVLVNGSKTGHVYLLDPNNLGQYDASGNNVLGDLQGACTQFDPKNGACQFDAVAQPANCQGAVQPDEAGFSACGPYTGVDNQGWWPHIHGSPIYWAEQHYLYFMGQYDYLRRLKLDPATRTFDVDSGDSFTYADAGQVAPTLGFGAVMSLSYNPTSGDGIIWMNARQPKEVANWPADASAAYTELLSTYELATGAFYAVDATSMKKLFADVPTNNQDSFVVSKFTPPTIYNGRVYIATFSNEILVYGNDQDGDGILDTMDNCPTVPNADQKNSNEDAERILAGSGTPVLLGDKCDPNATTSYSPLPPKGDNGDLASDGVSVACSQITINTVTCGGSATTSTTCPRTFNTQLTMFAHIGNDAGTAPNANGTTGPAFCKCNSTNQYLCLLPAGSGGKGCDGANDSHFPALDGGAFTDWKSISQLVDGGSAQWFSPVAMTHSESESVWSSARATWDYPNDLLRFGGNIDAGLGLCDATSNCGLQGELWAHVMTFTPDAGENALVSNLNNHYLNATAQYVAPYLKVAWVPCTRPVFEKWKWGQQAYGPQTWNQDPTWMFPLTSGVAMQSGSGVVDATSEFTSNALSVLEPLTGGSTATFFVESAGARNLGTSKVLATVMTPVAGTNNVVLSDALVASGTQVDAVAAVSGDMHNTISYAVLEALDSESGRLYALTNNGGTEGLTTVDVSGALNNFLYAQSSVSLSGTTFSTALALEYSQANGKLYLLDRLASGDVYYLRLSSITTAGVMTELWRTTGVSLTAFPTAFLSATPQGSLVVSLQSGSTAETMVVDGSGNPMGSYNASGSITSSAMLGASGGVWFPFENIDPASGLHSLAPSYQPLLLDGICGTSWLLAHAGSSGELSTSKATCNAIYNGGFETGTFLDWTTTGQVETISSNAHTNHFSAMLGSAAPTNGDSTVKQTFTVPSAGGTLGFYWSSTCPDTVTYDWFTATLQNTSGATLATIVSKTCAASSAWTHATLNLSTWQGQTVVVVLTSHDDNFVGDATYSFVDDVVVQ